MSRRRSDPTPPLPNDTARPSNRDRQRLDDVAGHRVMRRFAVGTRATLLLAHPTSPGAREDSRPRLVKVFHSHTAASSVDVELAALSTAATPHVVRLIDVASIDSGEPPCLVLERLPGPALSSYLTEHDTVSAGQAVTILAPLCATVQALHDAGVTHGAIHVRRIVFDHRGSPTLTGFGRGMLRRTPDAIRAAAFPRERLRPGAAEESRETAWRAAILDDQRHLLAVVDEVLVRVDSLRPSHLVDMSELADTIGEGSSREFLSRLETMLFALAIPQNVAITGAGSTAGSRSPVERPSAASVSVEHSTPSTEYDWTQPTSVPVPIPAEHRLVAALRVLGASSAALDVASTIIDASTRLTTRRLTDRAATSVESVSANRKPHRRWGRRSLLVGASCAVLTTTALLITLPSSSDEAQAGAGAVESTRVPQDVVPSDETTDSSATDNAPSLLGEDPAEALRALSFMNDGCSATSADNCRSTVFQPQYLESLPTGEPQIVIDAADAVATGVWGGSALVAARLNDQPASFLLVKGEAGWRVRDVFVSDQ